MRVKLIGNTLFPLLIIHLELFFGVIKYSSIYLQISRYLVFFYTRVYLCKNIATSFCLSIHWSIV